MRIDIDALIHITNPSKRFIMDHVVEMIFKYRHDNYSCIANISVVPEGYYVHIEMLDDKLIELFDGADIGFLNAHGYRTLPAYKNKVVRPLLIHMVSCVQSVRLVLHKHPGK